MALLGRNRRQWSEENAKPVRLLLPAEERCSDYHRLWWSSLQSIWLWFSVMWFIKAFPLSLLSCFQNKMGSFSQHQSNSFSCVLAAPLTAALNPPTHLLNILRHWLFTPALCSDYSSSNTLTVWLYMSLSEEGCACLLFYWIKEYIEHK